MTDDLGVFSFANDGECCDEFLMGLAGMKDVNVAGREDAITGEAEPRLNSLDGELLAKAGRNIGGVLGAV